MTEEGELIVGGDARNSFIVQQVRIAGQATMRDGETGWTDDDAYLSPDYTSSIVSRQTPYVEVSLKLNRVKTNRFGDGTRQNYRNSNMYFIIWLIDNFESNEDLWSEGVYSVLENANLEDIASTRTHSRKHLRAAVRVMVERTSPVYCCLNLKIMKIDTFAEYLVSCCKNDGTYMSYSIYNGKDSTLIIIFKVSKFVMSDEFYFDLSEFHAGLKQTI